MTSALCDTMDVYKVMNMYHTEVCLHVSQSRVRIPTLNNTLHFVFWYSLCLLIYDFYYFNLNLQLVIRVNPEAKFWAQEGWEWGVEKAPQWGTS